MRISAKGDYACKAMLDIILNRTPEKPVQIQEIATRQNIPIKFLEQILVSLKRAGMLESRRGAGGGYFLAKDPSEITLSDVLRTTDGPLFEPGCAILSGEDSSQGCPIETNCIFRQVWADVDKAIDKVLGGVNFAELAERHKMGSEIMYYI